tara:strand:- start:581 stop:976 length:396 start_codon:yes stop_codon:yes gene_type:complete
MRLAELLMENSEKEKTGISQVDSILDNIFDIQASSNQLPIRAKESKWITMENPTRLVRTFMLENSGKVKYFVNELIEYQERNYHHCTVIINGHDVTIETFTHDLDDITDQDILLSKFCDEIFEDTRHVANE